MDFRKLLQSTQYDFIRNHERLGDRIMLLGVGGSYAYGTSNENSDVDFRGVTLQLPSDLIGLTGFQQYEDDRTDTVIYGFNKLVKLLLECNPNTCEMLGLEEEQYLIKSKLGQELIDNSSLFLSKRAIRSFGGYADAQLRRLQNAIARDSLPQSEREKHILKSVNNALDDFNRRHAGKKAEVSGFILIKRKIRNWIRKFLWMQSISTFHSGIIQTCGVPCGLWCGSMTRLENGIKRKMITT